MLHCRSAHLTVTPSPHKPTSSPYFGSPSSSSSSSSPADRHAAKLKHLEEKETKCASRAAARSLDTCACVGALVLRREDQDLLWVDRYAPKTPDEIIGNEGNVKRLMEYLQNWSVSHALGWSIACESRLRADTGQKSDSTARCCLLARLVRAKRPPPT